MDERFVDFIESLDPSYRTLMSRDPVRIADLGKSAPKAGIYLLSEGSNHLYVGRSDRIRQRLARHSRRSSPPGSAAFAFRLAREATGRLRPSYKPEGSRTDLMSDPDFSHEFDEAKTRIRLMDVRVVSEPDPVRQALLEIYVATVLRTPYNSFENHLWLPRVDGHLLSSIS